MTQSALFGGTHPRAPEPECGHGSEPDVTVQPGSPPHRHLGTRLTAAPLGA